jgi:hypothetical protein
MSTNVPTITRADAESLAAKLAEFGGSLPAPEQALLWRALSSASSGSPSGSDEVQGYTLIELVSPDQLRSLCLGLLGLDAVRLTGRWK